MDPLLLSGLVAVGEGLIANTLSTIAAEIGGIRARETTGGQDGQIAIVGTWLTTVLQDGFASLAKTVDLSDPDRARKLRAFLSSPEAAAIVRQVYANQLLRKPTHGGMIRAELAAATSLYLGQPSERISDALYEVLLQSCDRALILSIEKGILSAHEARSAARHRVILDAIASIEKNLAFLEGTSKSDVDAILEFEAKYRAQVADRHRSITPPAPGCCSEASNRSNLCSPWVRADS